LYGLLHNTGTQAAVIRCVSSLQTDCPLEAIQSGGAAAGLMGQQAEQMPSRGMLGFLGHQLTQQLFGADVLSGLEQS
jgi:hypothetical protein